jgi:hypothetical protein
MATDTVFNIEMSSGHPDSQTPAVDHTYCRVHCLSTEDLV